MDGQAQAAPPAAKGGLFGPKPAAAPAFDVGEVQSDINSLSTRLRIGEERANDLRRQLQFIEQQSLANHKKVASEVKLLSGEMTDLRHSISELQNKMILLIKELQLMAKKSDLDVLRRYLDMWEPVKFVSQNQVLKIIEEELQKRGLDNKTEAEQ